MQKYHDWQNRYQYLCTLRVYFPIEEWSRPIVKTILAYMPMFSPYISTKAFKSFTELITEPIPGIRIEPFISQSFPLDFSRNQAVYNLLYQSGADYILFCDGDMTFPKGSVPMLLETISDQFPVVTGFYNRKAHPFNAVTGRYVQDHPHITPNHYWLEQNGFIAPDGRQCLMHSPIHYFHEKGPFQVDVFGMGIVLASAEAFKRIGPPWFKYFDSFVGDCPFGKVSEEMILCAKLKKAGIKVLCDPRVVCGHITERIVTHFDAECAYDEMKTRSDLPKGLIDVREEQDKGYELPASA